MAPEQLPIHCFFHCALMGRFDPIFDEIMGAILNSGLQAAATSITICFVGNDDSKFNKTRERLEPYANIRCIWKSHDVKQYEYPTLQELWNKCQKEDVLVQYCHTKGVTHYEPERKMDPKLIASNENNRKEFIRLTINEWQNCVQKISEYDGCGILRRRRRIFSGNFWWSKSSYIRTLPFPATQEDRFKAEWWMGLNPNKKFYYLNWPRGI